MADLYDRTGKWMVGHHGSSILRLAGVQGVVRCRAAQAEVVQPRQLPDGLLEAFLETRDDPVPYVVELATFPERRAVRQAVRDALLVFLDREEVPEVVVIVLHTKGRYRIPGRHRAASFSGQTGLSVRWRVVELWNVPAADLLATNDVGLLPWVPLARIGGPAEPVLRECRRRIEQQAPESERLNLLATCQVLGRLRYNRDMLVSIFGGTPAMTESEVMQEILADREIMAHSPVLREMVREAHCEARQNDILRVLAARFGDVPDDLAAALRAVTDDARLDGLLEWAARCPELSAFQARLVS